MQLRCTYCQTMFAISRDEMLAALQHMDQHKQKYYDAHCPKCRRANRVEGKRIELFFPEWKKTIKAMVQAAATDAEVEDKPARKAAEVGSGKAPNKTGAKMTAGKKPAAKVGKAATPKGKATAPKKTGAKAAGGIKKK
jgi:hypothetical protein